MTNEEESWHVVGKTNKQKNQSQAENKNQRKAWLENMPTFQQRDPIQEGTGMFDAFIKKQEKEDAKKNIAAQPTKIPALAPTKKTAPNDKKKKPAVVVQKKKPMTFIEALNKISHKQLAATLDNCRLNFPNNEDIWMKDIASFLNIALDTVPDTDPVYKGKRPGFPHCELSVDCQSLLRDLVASAPKELLGQMFHYCIQVINSERGKGHATHGYCLFVQSIVLYQPDVIAGKTAQYIEMIKTNHQKPSNALAVMWAVGQCGVNDIRKGLKLWLEVMLPFITIRPFASYIVLYLEHVLRGDVTRAYGVMTIRDFFPLLDLIFNTVPTIQSDLKIRLSKLYPKLKQISITAEPEKNLHLFFPSLLTRLAPSCAGALRAELLSSLVTCLAEDPQSLSVWRQMYTKHLPQSGVLLGHMRYRWPEVKKTIGEQAIMATLQSFDVTNAELVASGKTAEIEKSGCSDICKGLLKKTVAPRMSWFWLLPLISATVAAIITYDIYAAKTFRSSRTLRFMEEYGILALTERVYTQSRYYTLLTASWLRANVPSCAEHAYATVVPYLSVAAYKTREMFVYLVEVTGPYRVWLTENAVKAYQSVYNWSPELWAKVPEYAWWTIDTLRHFLTLLSQYTILLTQRAAGWLHHNLFTGEAGSVGEVLSSVRSTIHTQMLRTYEWCSAIVTSWQ